MPNPYEDIFEDNEGKKKPTQSEPQLDAQEEYQPMEFAEDDFIMDGKEPLDEILEGLQVFQKKAETFSRSLSQIGVVDHLVDSSLLRFFVIRKDKHNKGSLRGERKYHELLISKFEKIIVPMRELAELHLQSVQQFNRDIDKHYFSVEKTDRNIKSDKLMAVDGINLQRRILADGASDLKILTDAIEGTERRIKSYINAGGRNNISAAEYAIITKKSSTLTSGRKHQFNYSFFDINLLDKTVISLGVYMKETSSQYLGKLLYAFEIN